MQARINKAVFIDKDGTLIPDIPYNVNPQLVTLTSTAAMALKKLQDANFLLILISNQSGVARGFFTENDLKAVSDKINQLLSDSGVKISGFYYCPHYAGGTVTAYAIDCDCRKPKPGLIVKATEDFNVDPSLSWMIGDTRGDMEAGRSAGCRTILIDGSERKQKEENMAADYVVSNLIEAAEIITAHS